MYKYKEAVERQVDSMYKKKPGLKKSRRASKLAAIMSFGAGIFILVFLARLYVGVFSEGFEGSYFILALILVVMVGISEFFIRHYILKK